MLTNTGFSWIVDAVHSLNCPYVICGGLAAIAYGSSRPLNDIDLYVPQLNYLDIVHYGRDYISFGPQRYIDNHWDVEYVQFTIDGQKIEVGCDHAIKIYNAHTKQWEEEFIDFDHFTWQWLYGHKVRVMNKSDLIAYKSKLARAVDKDDIQQMNSTLTIKNTQ